MRNCGDQYDVDVILFTKIFTTQLSKTHMGEIMFKVTDFFNYFLDQGRK